MLTPEQRRRDARIAAARAAGEPWAVIAEREGVSLRHARRCALSCERRAGTPEEIADEVAERVRAFIIKWEPRPGCCGYCGKRIARGMKKAWLRLAWEVERINPAGGPNHLRAEPLHLEIIMCRSCNTKHFNGIAPEQGRLDVGGG